MEKWINKINSETNGTLAGFIGALMSTQYDTDSILCGEGYVERGTCLKTEKPMVPEYAILDELSELLGSKDWKHWKFGEADDDNIITELIDILHFIPSLTLLYNKTAAGDIVHVGKEFSNYTDLPLLYTGDDEAKSLDTVFILGSQVVLVALTIKNDFYVGAKEEALELLNKAICSLLLQCISYLNNIKGLDLNQIWEEYIIKNKLNLLRSNKGYKDGSYKKEWAGEEDNVVARRIYYSLSKFISEGMLDSVKFYDKLEYVYDNHVKLTDSLPTEFCK